MVVLVFAVIALAVLAWIVYASAGLILAFTAFVMGLPTILVILMFVIFPPTFVVFLIGVAMLKLGVADAMFGEKNPDPGVIQAHPYVPKREPEAFDFSGKRMLILFAIMLVIVVGLVALGAISKGT
jgi:hypothetical protein